MKTFDDDFKYTPVVNEKTGAEYFETYGEELAVVKRANPKHIWTVVEGDEGKLIVIPGFHVVNRFLYILTEEPIRPEDENEEYLYE